MYSAMNLAMRSKAWVCGRSLAVGLRLRFPPRSMDVCLLGLLCIVCDEPIRHSEESYRARLCGCVSLSVIKCNNNPLHQQCVGRKR